MKIKKILIANRGEIALRIIRTCQKLNIQTVCIYSKADMFSSFVKASHESYYIGESNSTDSYLHISKIIELAKTSQVDAIHPGYGFLSENSEFAKRVVEEGFLFIGPSPEIISLMGDKVASRETVRNLSLPIVPGYSSSNQDINHLLKEAKKIGFPVMIKASAGGGGKGMRKVLDESEFTPALESAKREAKNFFGSDEVFLEKFVTNPRHIEIQIMGDTHGNVFSLLERDCTVQRRHQKIIEECPAPNLNSELRKKISEVAIKISKSIGYVGAGTVEFILSDTNEFYFMEMNTRLQVEHPVTEEVTGLDLVELQIRVAQGESLDLKIEEPKTHSIELRVYTEDPENNFLPSVGKIHFLKYPDSIRIENGVEIGSEVSIYYDPMISKFISKGKDRKEAIEKLIQAIESSVVFGLVTNLGYLKKILENPIFQSGKFSTHFLEENFSKYQADRNQTKALAYIYIFDKIKFISSGIHNALLNKIDLSIDSILELKNHQEIFSFQNIEFKILLTQKVDSKYTFKINSELIEIEFDLNKVQFINGAFVFENKIYYFKYGKTHFLFADSIVYSSEKILLETSIQEKTNSYKSPMPGKLTKLFVKENEAIKKGDILFIVEAMKMENPVKAISDSVINKIHFKEGDLIKQDEVILEV